MGLKRRTVAMCGRRAAIRRKGKRRFKQLEDPAFMAFMAQRLARGWPCDCGCGRRATDRAHLTAKGSGLRPVRDLGNVVLLTRHPCHQPNQEKRTDAFIRECGKDLYAVAAGHARDFTDGKDDEYAF